MQFFPSGLIFTSIKEHLRESTIRLMVLHLRERLHLSTTLPTTTKALSIITSRPCSTRIGPVHSLSSITTLRTRVLTQSLDTNVSQVSGSFYVSITNLRRMIDVRRFQIQAIRSQNCSHYRWTTSRLYLQQRQLHLRPSTVPQSCSNHGRLRQPYHQQCRRCLAVGDWLVTRRSEKNDRS